MNIFHYTLLLGFAMLLAFGILSEHPAQQVFARTPSPEMQIAFRPMSANDSCVYLMSNDLLVIEMESGTTVEKWEKQTTATEYTGDGYIIWTGGQFFNQRGNGEINYQIYVPTTGEYRFIWRSRIMKGTQASEHNDTWLKINGSDFFGRKNDGNIVHPRPTCTSNNDCPAGSSGDGFFKVYGSSPTEWIWNAFTSDHDSHKIYVKFDSPGFYQITLNARSSFHAIDRMVLYKEGTISYNGARDTSLVASAIDCSGAVSISHSELPAANIYPVGERLQIELSKAHEASFELLDLQGKMLQQGEFQGREHSVPMPQTAGVYLIRLRIGDQFISRKFVRR
ncbi:T9SS type A sorting domain-containing protein [Pontibacter sp. G13]|uniref:T9SS type A sorting domain-containing protein n=1 Tax=Pontibacter sp. G13 TaxID=3074898 RepID=UPI0028893FDF|nr:T9SS type A sorting domain-containing protein [Pontibacter sp. G13]WNJ20433.1 T9SS type A sorting domain-containing protein [Pontibacter sp. G13]